MYLGRGDGVISYEEIPCKFICYSLAIWIWRRGGGQGSGQIIDKGAKQPIFFYSSIQPPFKLSFITIKCKSMADVLKKEGNIKN